MARRMDNKHALYPSPPPRRPQLLLCCGRDTTRCRSIETSRRILRVPRCFPWSTERTEWTGVSLCYCCSASNDNHGDTPACFPTFFFLFLVGCTIYWSFLWSHINFFSVRDFRVHPPPGIATVGRLKTKECAAVNSRHTPL